MQWIRGNMVIVGNLIGNGNGKVVLVAISIYRRLTIYFVTITTHVGHVRKSNQKVLIEIIFILMCQVQ